MLRSIAFQLAELLPGFAEPLCKAAAAHGDGSGLATLDEVFDALLLEPMRVQQASATADCPDIVLLLDALDEAADGAQDWRAVARLVANKFTSLPDCVKLIVTSRPEAAALLNTWKPDSIEPKEADNMEDVRIILEAQLRCSGRVEQADIQDAAAALRKKSGGQLIYAKYAIDYLYLRDMWTPAELQQVLPSGLGGAYALLMGTLADVLRREEPATWELIHGKLLPILVVMREPMTVAAVAWACDVPLSDVQHALRLIGGLLRTRLEQVDVAAWGEVLVQPYHKSVIDWLLAEAGMDPGEFRANVAAGHRLLASASLRECDAPPSRAYALRYAIWHACQPGGDAELAQQLLLDLRLDGAWQRAYDAGQGPAVLTDLLEALQRGVPADAEGAATDMRRCLRYFAHRLAHSQDARQEGHAMSVMEAAMNSPLDTLVRRVARVAASQDGKAWLRMLLSFENAWHEWPALDLTLSVSGACLDTIPLHPSMGGLGRYLPPCGPVA